jgi:hypothetical protein
VFGAATIALPADIGKAFDIDCHIYENHPIPVFQLYFLCNVREYFLARTFDTRSERKYPAASLFFDW